MLYEAKYKIMKRLFLFETLKQEEIEEVSKFFREKVYVPGLKIFAEGDEGNVMYIIKSGSVKITKEDEGIRKDIAALKKGDFFGEIALFERIPRTAAAIPLEETELYQLSRSDFGNLISKNTSLGVKILYRIILSLGDRLKNMNQQNKELALELKKAKDLFK